MQYSIKEEVNPNTEKEFVVVDSQGEKVPLPNTFKSRGAALVRLAELLRAKHPKPGMRCHGKIVDASDTLLIQHLGMNQYALHRRADSAAFSGIEVGDVVSIIDGNVEYPNRNRSRGLSM